MSDAPTASRNYLVVGATSGIAKALMRKLADDANRKRQMIGMILAGRDLDELERLAADLKTRSGVAVAARAFDAENLAAIPAFFADCLTALPGGLHDLVLCHGWLPDVGQSQHDPAIMRRLIDVNYTSAVIVLELAADYFERQKSGAITGISSVAGDRGRQSNYPYGASKAALSTYLQGVRNRLLRARSDGKTRFYRYRHDLGSYPSGQSVERLS